MPSYSLAQCAGSSCIALHCSPCSQNLNCGRQIKLTGTLSPFMQGEPLEVIIAEGQQHGQLVDGVAVSCEQCLCDQCVPCVPLDKFTTAHDAILTSEDKPEKPFSNHPTELHHTQDLVKQHCSANEVCKLKLCFVALRRAYDELVGSFTKFDQEGIETNDEADHPTYNEPSHIPIVGFRVPVEEVRKQVLDEDLWSSRKEHQQRTVDSDHGDQIEEQVLSRVPAQAVPTLDT